MMKPISFFFQIANSYEQEKADLNLKKKNSGFFSQGSFEGPFRVYFWGPFESLFVGLFRAKQRSLLFGISEYMI